MKKIVFCTSLSFCCLISFCQKNEISGGVSGESPQGDIGKIYSDGPQFQLTYGRYSMGKKRQRVIGVTLAYLAMNPKEAVFTYPVDDGSGTGTATYSTYKAYQLMGSFRRIKKLGEVVSTYGGMDFGIHYTTYDYSLYDGIQSTDGSVRTTRVVVAPKGGFSFSLSKSLSLYLQWRYVLSLGHNNKESSNFNGYASAGTGLAYRF